MEHSDNTAAAICTVPATDPANDGPAADSAATQHTSLDVKARSFIDRSKFVAARRKATTPLAGAMVAALHESSINRRFAAANDQLPYR
jgi:hypothetical protein